LAVALIVVLAGVALLAALLGPAPLNAPQAPTQTAAASPAASAARGALLFAEEGCASCHRPAGTSRALGPPLAGLAERAAARLEAPDYRGSAETPDDYVREAVLDHCADLVPGYRCPTAPDIGLRRSTEEVADLVRFLLDAGVR
jgi:mono/diheme cytochrome c family protein